jgi:UTP--glucose-1-phosphate uridylyltransferase
VGGEPFAILLPDDLIEGTEESCLKQMIKQFDKIQTSIVSVEKIKPEDSKRYGVVGFNKSLGEIEALEKINQIIEKPETSDMPSSFGVVGRYILMPSIFPLLEKVRPDPNGEIQLTDAISQLLQKECVYAHQFKGQRFDCGSKLGYLQAIVSFGLKHTEVGSHFKDYLKYAYGIS